MKRICNLLIVVLMLSFAVGAVGCAAKFEVSSLEVSPEVCLAGDTVMVSATLANTGNAVGDYVTELLVNDAMEETQTFTLEPGSSQSLSFTLIKSEPGRYAIQLAELTASFTVLGVSNLKVSPSQVEAHQPVTVTADLQNTAETQATYHCCLACQGKEVEVKDITVAGGSIEKVTFTLSQATSGMYNIELLGLSGSFKVLMPAEFKVVNLDIAPNPVKVGEEATITVTIANMGEAESTYKATLLLDGRVYHTSDVTLAGGARKSVSVVASKDTPGSYSIEIGGREAILTVIQPVRLETGTELVDELVGGMGKLKIENETEFDAVVVLCSPEEPKTPLLAVYVQSNDSYRAKGIEEGSYVSYVALGDGWDENSLKFLMNTTYYHHPREMEFKERRTERKREWTEWTVVLNLEYGTPGLPITEDEFPSLE